MIGDVLPQIGHGGHAVSDPVCAQVIEKLVLRIANGDLRQRSALPPLRRIAFDHGVSMTKARRAVQALEDRGYIVRHLNKWFVGELPDSVVPDREPWWPAVPVDELSYERRSKLMLVALHIEEVALSGVVEPGAQLPSINHLATVYGVSRESIRRAIDVCRTRGVIAPPTSQYLYMDVRLRDSRAAGSPA